MWIKLQVHCIGIIPQTPLAQPRWLYIHISLHLLRYGKPDCQYLSPSPAILINHQKQNPFCRFLMVHFDSSRVSTISLQAKKKTKSHLVCKWIKCCIGFKILLAQSLLISPILSFSGSQSLLMHWSIEFLVCDITTSVT